MGVPGGEGTGGLTLALLDTLLQTAPVGLGYVDRDLRFVVVNEMLAAMNGVSVADHAGRRVRDVIPRLAHVVEPILQRVLATETAEADLELSSDDDDRHWIASYYPVREQGGGLTVGVGVVIRDVTSERVATRELDVRARHLEAVAALGQRALISDDWDGLLHEATAEVATILRADMVHVMEHEREAGQFVVRATHHSGVKVGSTLPDDPVFQPGYALANRLPMAVRDVRGDDRFEPNPLIAGTGVAGSLSVVIRGPGWPFGVINCFSLAPREFRSEEIDFVQSMANVLGTAAARHKTDTALRNERERLRLALDAGGMGDWQWDIASGRVSWSESVERIYGLEPGTFGGTLEAYRALIHPDDRDANSRAIEEALGGDGVHDEDSPFTVQHRVLLADGGVRWVRGNGKVVRDDQGHPVGMIGVSQDITDRVLAEERQAQLFAAEQEARAEAEAARDRLEFLAEASEVLASSLDYRATLSQVAHLAVSRLADWCTVDVVDDELGSGSGADGGFATVVVAHVDPTKVELAASLRDRYPPDPESADGVAGVIRSGQPQVIPVVTDAMVEAAAVDDEHLAALRHLGLRSVLMVPLIARGRTLGVISLVSAESGRVYGDADLALATDLARRAALAIDNALLYRERSQVADALQRSLLPPRRPEIPGMEVAVRYRPVGRGSEIGGDFYDVFESALGMYSVVIGDVCGKGTAAAAITGLARDTIRGVSIRETSPRRVLTVLNEVVLRREDSARFLTVAMARVEPPSTTGAAARLRVAAAGHPLPLVVRADGSVAEAGRHSLLLGLFPEVDPVDVDLVLAPGEAMVFFTDGVIEEQGEEDRFGEDRLRALLAEVGPVDAETIAQAVLDAVAAWTPGPPQDDVAIVVLRVPPAV